MGCDMTATQMQAAVRARLAKYQPLKPGQRPYAALVRCKDGLVYRAYQDGVTDTGARLCRPKNASSGGFFMLWTNIARYYEVVGSGVVEHSQHHSVRGEQP